MTRSTARPSCSEICSREISGTLWSPRRALASRRWAFSMARSPPLTATYMRLASLVHDARGARDRDHGIVGDQHHIDAARKQRFVDAQALEQIERLDRRLERRDTVDAGSAQVEAASRIQAIDLKDQRGRAIRIFAGAQRETLERRQRRAVADQREACDRRILHHRRA